MIYSCQHCGAWFRADQITAATKNGDRIIVCEYCGLPNEIGEMKNSHTAKGYDALGQGDFYNAEGEFRSALKRANDTRDPGAKGHLLDAYIGLALTQFSTQVVFEDEIADDAKDPDIYCHACFEDYFAESYEYRAASEIIDYIKDSGLRSNARRRLNIYAKFIDGIKEVYDRKARTNEKYQLFIAYEDTSKDKVADYKIANDIRNTLSPAINKVFLPNFDDYNIDRIKYEGEMLYAIHNSQCMIAVVDDDMDSRLLNLYSVYYNVMMEENDQRNKKSLGFVRYKSHVHIHLPDAKASASVYEIEDVNGYNKFICDANNLIYQYRGSQREIDEQKRIEEEKEEQRRAEEEYRLKELEIKKAPIFEDRFCHFGEYPQTLVRDIAINDQFKRFPRPTPSNPNGWTEMFKSKTGQTYTWYRDAEIDGKKYRGVYFIKFREVFSARQSNLAPYVQRKENYMPMRVYVFAFEPVEWNVLEMSQNNAVLVSSMGIDCHEYNNSEEFIPWEYCSLHQWLNDDLLTTVFNVEQLEYIFHKDEEYISILDKDADFAKKSRRDKVDSYNITGSDYFKCMGGVCDKNVSNFWINGSAMSDSSSIFDVDDGSKAATVQPHIVSNTVNQYVDNTSVSVVPKIIVKLP